MSLAESLSSPIDQGWVVYSIMHSSDRLTCKSSALIGIREVGYDWQCESSSNLLDNVNQAYVLQFSRSVFWWLRLVGRLYVF